LGELRGKTVGVLGLTYKPNTDTLRRSESVALCRWLAQQGAVVRAHDPAIRSDSPDLPEGVALCASAAEAIRGGAAVVVATEWPVFRELTAERVSALAPGAVVLDANRFLAGALSGDTRLRYFAVGVGDVTP